MVQKLSIIKDLKLKIICLVNTYILNYWYARCDCKLWNVFWCYCVFRVFSYIIDEHWCLNCCKFIKLSQIVCLINPHILVCRHAKSYCRVWNVIWFNCVFFGNFHMIDTLYFHQTFTNCVLKQKCTEKLQANP